MQASRLPLDQVAALVSTCFGDPHPMSVETLAAHADSWDLKLSHSEVIRRRGTNLAVGCLGIRGWAGWLAFIGVLPEARGRGWGLEVCRRLVHRARRRRLTRLRLEVRQDNPVALHIYESLGFQTLRSLDIWEHPGPALPLELSTPWRLVPRPLRQLLPAATPWQRHPKPWLPCVFNEDACIVFGNAESLSMRQLLGPREALERLLDQIGPGWRFNNLESDSPLSDLLTSRGGRVTLRQWEMALEL